MLAHKLRPGKKIICTLLIVALVAIPFSTLPKKAEAQWTVLDPANLIQGIATVVQVTISAIANFAIQMKEFVFDGLLNAVAKQILRQMTDDIVQWINGGFSGSPAFVEDFGGFLTGIGDQIAGQFIEDIGLGALCSPFKLDLQIALALNYSANYEHDKRCTFSDIVDNIEGFVEGTFDQVGFMAGDFNQGGWPGWFASFQPENNIYGSYLEAQAEVGARIAYKQGEET
ncbi:MAG: hypothetical protein Q7S15_02435, partial [bacterium]|nr:hypothetical protein [bacterium]